MHLDVGASRLIVCHWPVLGKHDHENDPMGNSVTGSRQEGPRRGKEELGDRAMALFGSGEIPLEGANQTPSLVCLIIS